MSNFPFPLRSPRNPELKTKDFQRVVGDYTYKIIASREYGYPFGLDSLILMLIEDLAQKTKNLKVSIKSVWQVLKKLGMGFGKNQYKRFLDGVKRLFHSKFMVFIGEDDAKGLNLEVFEAVNLRGLEKFKAELGNFIALSKSHFDRLMKSSIPYDLGVFRRLSAGASALYRFLAPRSYKAFADKNGSAWMNSEQLLNQIGSEPCSQKFKQIQMLRKWKSELDSVLFETAGLTAPMTVDRYGRVSVEPRLIVPGVAAIINGEPVIFKAKSGPQKNLGIREFFDPKSTDHASSSEWVPDAEKEKALEEFKDGIVSEVPPAVAQYSAEKAAYIEINQPETDEQTAEKAHSEEPHDGVTASIESVQARAEIERIEREMQGYHDAIKNEEQPFFREEFLKSIRGLKKRKEKLLEQHYA